MRYPTLSVGLIVLFASASANAADQILTFDGLGPVRIGMTVRQAEMALGAKLKPMDPSNGVDTEACWETTRADDPDPFVSYMIWSGTIVRIDIGTGRIQQATPPIATERGIRLNSSVEDVKKAYSPRLVSNFHSQGDIGNYDLLYMTVLSDDRRYGHFFVTWKNGLTSMGTADTKAIQLQEGCQ